jgi:DNA invertase Pin-like site-specific DNA recombinase
MGLTVSGSPRERLQRPARHVTHACLYECGCSTDRGWNPVDYVVNDTSATSGKPRKDYRRMLLNFEAGYLESVVTWDLNRLHRLPSSSSTSLIWPTGIG